MAIQDMYNKITYSLENRELVMGIFIDLAKAFDTVNHSILLRKLEHYGVRGIALQWFADYLSRRKQSVCFNNVSSSLMNITLVSPKGQFLDPCCLSCISMTLETAQVYFTLFYLLTIPIYFTPVIINMT
jgi:hypothetical protein